VDQNSNLEIRFNTQAALISDEELALIESIMPELTLAMMQNHQADD